jgi:F-box protein 28
MSFKEISILRTISRRFNEICASMLNSTFQRLQSQMLSRFQEIKTQMPRRESARRNHPLAQECDVVETLHMRLSLLQMTFGKHIERKHVCFFAGEILDEVQRIMRYIRHTSNLPPKGRTAYIFMEDELFDLTTMAMEYFKEHIEPTLPEITYFGADFLDFTSFATPTKRRSVSGSTSILGNGLDSPCSSRASVAGSCVSEVWSTASTAATTDMTDMESGVQPPQPPQSNMVLRKRIRRIRQGMKRYNDQLVEVKKELKVCKSKMETQSKQVTEYSQRLEDYDKKFEESSRKFQTLLTELNKCKTELQYWRSKSTTLLALPSTCASCSAPLLPSQSAEEAEAELKALANQGIFLTDENLADTEGQVQNSKEPQQNIEEPGATTSASLLVSNIAGPASPNLRSSSTTCKSGPPSPVSAVGRKRKSRDDLSSMVEDPEAASIDPGDLKRKTSLRGSGSVSGTKNTRFKRPKTASAN